MDKHFDYEDVDEENKVTQEVTRLKEHASLWLDKMQGEWRIKGKKRIKNWDMMVAKLKDMFIPKDSQINLFRSL